MAILTIGQSSLVVYALQHGKLPSLSPSVLLYQQISLHGFNLSQWVSDEGAEVCTIQCTIQCTDCTNQCTIQCTIQCTVHMHMHASTQCARLCARLHATHLSQ